MYARHLGTDKPGKTFSDCFFGVYLLHSAKPSHGYLLRATMAKIREYFAQAFPPKPKFRIEDIPDLSDKVIVVTGMSGHQIGNLSCHIY